MAGTEGSGGRDLSHEWQQLVREMVDRERRLRHDVVTRLAAPADAVFNLLEESAAAMRSQGDALEAASAALAETAGLVKRQAELFEATLARLREPAELVKAAAGGERRPPENDQPS